MHQTFLVSGVRKTTGSEDMLMQIVKKSLLKICLFLFGMMCWGEVYAEESFRYLHVTIETPWMIFIFLLVIIMFPFILTAVLYWYFAYKKNAEERIAEQQPPIE